MWHWANPKFFCDTFYSNIHLEYFRMILFLHISISVIKRFFIRKSVIVIRKRRKGYTRMVSSSSSSSAQCVGIAMTLRSPCISILLKHTFIREYEACFLCVVVGCDVSECGVSVVVSWLVTVLASEIERSK